MGHAFLRGNGAGQPLGMFETPAAKSITRAGANAMATAYLLADCQEIEVLYSQNTPAQFIKNQGVYRFAWRGDGQPALANTINLEDGAKTASSYIYLGST